MKIILGAALLLALAAVPQTSIAANLIQNGSFESPNVQGFPNSSAFNIPAGSSLITGWNITQGNVDLTHICCYTPPYAGVQAVDLIGDTNGTGGVYGGISQIFSTVLGQEYNLSFAYFHNLGGFAPIYSAQVGIADATNLANSLLSSEVSQPLSETAYQIFSQNFVAASNSTLLTFTATRGGFNAGIYLDDVSVQAVTAAVPEPSTWAMMFLGFAGVAGMAYRRSRRRDDSALTAA